MMAMASGTRRDGLDTCCAAITLCATRDQRDQQHDDDAAEDHIAPGKGAPVVRVRIRIVWWPRRRQGCQALRERVRVQTWCDVVGALGLRISRKLESERVLPGF